MNLGELRNGDTKLPEEIVKELEFMKSLGFFKDDKYISAIELHLDDSTLEALKKISNIYDVTMRIPKKDTYSSILSGYDTRENFVDVRILLEGDEDKMESSVTELFSNLRSLYRVSFEFPGDIEIYSLGPIEGGKDIEINVNSARISEINCKYIDHLKIGKDVVIDKMEVENSIVEVEGLISSIKAGGNVVIVANQIDEIVGERGIVVANDIYAVKGELKVLKNMPSTSLLDALELRNEIIQLDHLSGDIIEKMKKYVLDYYNLKRLINIGNEITKSSKSGRLVVTTENKDDILRYLTNWLSKIG